MYFEGYIYIYLISMPKCQWTDEHTKTNLNDVWLTHPKHSRSFNGPLIFEEKFGFRSWQDWSGSFKPSVGIYSCIWQIDVIFVTARTKHGLLRQVNMAMSSKKNIFILPTDCVENKTYTLTYSCEISPDCSKKLIAFAFSSQKQSFTNTFFKIQKIFLPKTIHRVRSSNVWAMPVS